MHTFIRVLALAAGLLSTAPAAAQPPTAQEATMIATVIDEHERSVALLERLVAVNSGSMNLQGVEEVGRILRAEFEQLGFQVRWVPMAETGRAGHLIATHRGPGRGKRLLLIGHLDTVFEPDSPFQDWKRTGDFAEGPGVVDMKGGDVIMIAALRAMHAAGTLKGADITVVLTGDEEKVGSPVAIARRDLIAAGRASDVALDFESVSREDGQDIGSIARRSSHNWTLRVRARSGHSSGVCRESCGANYELGRIIEAFRNELPEPNATVSVAMIAGGAQAAANDAATGVSATGKTNIIPAEAVAIGDIRTLSNEQEERVRARMRAIVARPLPQAQAVLEFGEGGYPPRAPTEGNRALLRKLNEVNATLGLPEMREGDPARRGAGDIAFVSFIDGLVGLGMAGTGSHAPGERADLRSINVQAQRAALLMSRLAKEPRRRR
jgi:glutamate carboxypeptidase